MNLTLDVRLAKGFIFLNGLSFHGQLVRGLIGSVPNEVQEAHESIEQFGLLYLLE